MKFFLVLLIAGGTTYAPAMTTIPEPFKTIEECRMAGEDWSKDNFRRNYYCTEHPGMR